MSSADNKKNMTWCLNNMLNGTNGAFLDRESASMSLVPCIQAALRFRSDGEAQEGETEQVSVVPKSARFFCH